jgi:hypothetical protein
MQDSVQLEELILIKDGIEHRVAGFFLTPLMSTYIKIAKVDSSTTVNYPYDSFEKFLKKSGFVPKPSQLYWYNSNISSLKLRGETVEEVMSFS